MAYRKALEEMLPNGTIKKEKAQLTTAEWAEKESGKESSQNVNETAGYLYLQICKILLKVCTLMYQNKILLAHLVVFPIWSAWEG